MLPMLPSSCGNVRRERKISMARGADLESAVSLGRPLPLSFLSRSRMVNLSRFQYPNLNDISDLQRRDRLPVDVNVAGRVGSRSQATDRIVNVECLITRSRRNCFLPELATRADDCVQNREVL